MGTQGPPSLPEASATEPPSSEGASPAPRRRRGSSLWGLLGVSLVLIGGGVVILADSSGTNRRPAERVLGHDAPVNLGARNPRDISAHNSPTVVRNPMRPQNLAVSSRIDTPFYSCGLHVSMDGGATWSQTAIPAPKGEEAKCFAPDVAFSADGTLHLAFVTLSGGGNVPHATWVSSSKDGGRTLSRPVRVLGPLAFQVRLVPDPVKPRRLYMTWLQANGVGRLKFTTLSNPIEAARSDDGGASWRAPVRVSSPSRQRVVTPSPTVGPNGDLYVLYLDLGGDSLDYAAGHGGKGGTPYRGPFKLVLGRSRDQGQTWQESLVDDKLVPIQRFLVFLATSPSVAVDKTGRVYAAFHDDRLGDPDVWVWSLKPGGSRWEGPVRVNDTRKHDGTAQYLPKLAVAPSGRLDVLYYDRRADPKSILNQVSLQSSYDKGKTFTRSLNLSSRTFDSRIGFGAKEGLPDLGSRLGLISDDRFALGLWTDTRAGTSATQKQDIAKAVVAVSKPSAGLSKAAEYTLRIGGLAAVLAGLALLVLGVGGRRPEKS